MIMTPENLINIISIGGALLGVVVGALLNHFLEKDRNKDSLILNKKIDIYSSLLVKLNTVFQDSEKNILNDPLFETTIRTTLAQSLSEARLIADAKLEQKLRDYYDEAVLFWENKKYDNTMPNLVIEIEQLMRIELGKERLH